MELAGEMGEAGQHLYWGLLPVCCRPVNRHHTLFPQGFV